MKREFVMVGNSLTLDFINTRICKQGQVIDLLEGTDDLSEWLECAGLLRYVSGSYAALDAETKQRLFTDFLRVRDVLMELVRDVMASGELTNGHKEQLNEELRKYPCTKQIDGQETDMHIESYYEAAYLPGAIVDNAAFLLTTVSPSKIKKCSNEECILFFYDNSRNASRRWCSMSTCGNRVKVNQHYHRKRGRE